MSGEALSWAELFLRQKFRINKLIGLLQQANWFEHYHSTTENGKIVYKRCDNPYHQDDIQEQYGEDDNRAYSKSPFVYGEKWR